LPGAALHSLVSSSLQVIVQLVRFVDGSRRVSSIHEVGGADDGGVALRELYSFQVQGLADDGGVRGKHVAAGVIPRFVEELEQRGISVPPSMFRG
jgi:pilus assembly protein CpaF